MASLKPRNTNGKIVLDQLTKEVFLNNISESRESQGESVENFDFNKSRCRVLSQNEKIKTRCNGIIYWMSRDCRVQDNWALLFAQRLALKQKSPLYVCFVCRDAHHLYPTIRHFKFLLDGLRIVKSECSDLNIGFYLLNVTIVDLVQICVNNSIGGIVCDFNPLRYTKELLKDLVNYLPDDIPLVQVDAHNIVPAWEASDKQEGMAKFFRPKITKKLSTFLTGFSAVSKHKYYGKLYTDKVLKNLDDAYKLYKPTWDVSYVEWGKGPGSNAALEMLLNFMVKKLQFYGITSNDPSKDVTSKLSPWLHFGKYYVDIRQHTCPK